MKKRNGFFYKAIILLSHIENVYYTWLLILSPVRNQTQTKHRPNTDHIVTPVADLDSLDI